VVFVALATTAAFFGLTTFGTATGTYSQIPNLLQ